METSLIENIKNNKPISHNFEITKNIPIDSRFIISSLSTIDNEIPLKLRYPGLIFFVSDAKLNDGTTDILTGLFYCFEADLTTPKSLHSLYERINIHQVNYATEDYSDLLTKLNKTFPREGKIVYIKPLDVAYLFNGTNWIYFSGIYTVSTEEAFLTIPVNLRKPGASVLVNGLSKKISSTGTLVDFFESVPALPGTGMEGNYYIVDGFLYFFVNGTYFQINNKVITKDISLTIGNNQIIHPLKSTYIFAFYRIKDLSNLEISANKIMSAEILSNNEDEISFYSSYEMDIEIILIAHKPTVVL